MKTFEQSGGAGKPKYGMVHVCVDGSRERAIDTAYRCWRNGALPGELGQELPLPRYFRQATSTLDREDVADQVVCGADAGMHREAIER